MKHPGLINTVIKDNNDFFQWSEKNFAKVQIIIEKCMLVFIHTYDRVESRPF